MGGKAHTRVLHWEIQNEYDLIAVEHDGYKKSGITHRRTICLLKPDILVVSDQILGKGHHKVEQFWHLAPGYKVEITGKRAALAMQEQKWVFELWSSPFNNLSVVEGQVDPIQGWVSTRYAQKKPAPVLVHSGVSTLPVKLLSVIYPGNFSQSWSEQIQKKTQLILKG